MFYPLNLKGEGFFLKPASVLLPVKKVLDENLPTKFIHYIIRNKHPIDQSELIYVTNLPRRTVQASIEEQKEQGLIIEKNSLDDARKKVYNLVRNEWI